MLRGGAADLRARWGCHNLEMPVSPLCRTEPFAWFACHLLADLPHFHAVYNAIVDDYRRHHGIRSRNHPVPDLAVEDDWLEAPFWGWRTAAGRRARPAVRAPPRIASNCVSVRRYGLAALPRRTHAVAAVEPGSNLGSRGFKVRSRALTTTLYARLFLADLFIHGIGGGKYDELTDELIRRFYECEPPIYMVLSATRWLPLPRLAAMTEDLPSRPRRARRALQPAASS